eukprot:13037802-Alexandrium_andersonii.AAC.1
MYEPQPNGSLENAARQLKGWIRTLMLALQGQIQGEIPVGHPVMLWLCRECRGAPRQAFGGPRRPDSVRA